METRHRLREIEAMPSPSDKADQSERRALVGSTATITKQADKSESTTYHQLAQVDSGLESGGRFGAAPQVTGSTPTPQYPPASGPWNETVRLPDEPPLGYAIDELEPVGSPVEPPSSE